MITMDINISLGATALRDVIKIHYQPTNMIKHKRAGPRRDRQGPSAVVRLPRPCRIRPGSPSCRLPPLISKPLGFYGSRHRATSILSLSETSCFTFPDDEYCWFMQHNDMNNNQALTRIACVFLLLVIHRGCSTDILVPGLHQKLCLLRT